MSVNSLPDWLRAKATEKFLDSAVPGDRAPAAALAKFLAKTSTDKKPDAYDAANIILDDRTEVANLIEIDRQEIEAEKIAAKEAHKSDHERRIEKFHTDHAARNKINSLISIVTNLGTLVTGLVMSPLLAILFKHQLTSLDKKLHPEDFQPKKEQVPTPLVCEQEISTEDFLSKSTHHHKTKENAAVHRDDGVVPVQNTPYGLRDLKTHQTMFELLEQGKKVLLPNGKNIIYLKAPSIPCRKALGYAAPALK